MGRNPAAQRRGGVYDPATDRWRPLPLAGDPTPRTSFSGVWTGTELVVWGGWAGLSSSNVLATGGRYNPATDAWRPTSSANGPGARMKASVVWTGEEMIVERLHQLRL